MKLPRQSLLTPVRFLACHLPARVFPRTLVSTQVFDGNASMVGLLLWYSCIAPPTLRALAASLGKFRLMKRRLLSQLYDFNCVQKIMTSRPRLRRQSIACKVALEAQRLVYEGE